MLKASIIIPTYNRSDVILRSLETWTKQTLATTDFEVIVVDNNSTDNSAGLIRGFIKDYPNFSYYKETKAGSTNARHAGARIAKGDILIFCDDDGLFNPSCVSEILRVYSLNKEVDAVAGKIEIEWDGEAPDWISPYLFMLGRLNYGTEIIYGRDLYLNGGIFSIRKQVFEELGGFNPDLIGNYLVGDGDTGLVIKLHEAGKLIGWTPFAEMKHLQFVNRQGTEKDMGRRFYNTGISNAYGFFRKSKFRFNGPVLNYILKTVLLLAKKQLEILTFATDKRKCYFSLMQRRGELAFFLNLRIKSIRRVIFDYDLI
ncbi:MAG: glycosyltransferase family 2 protein [Paludibacter sp.]